jgi:hypothetical protein
MAEDDENHSGKKNEGLLLMDPCRPAKVERKLKKKMKRNADPRPQTVKPLSLFFLFSIFKNGKRVFFFFSFRWQSKIRRKKQQDKFLFCW